MTNDERPIEPSVILDANGTPVAYHRRQPWPAPTAIRRSLLPALVRTVAAGPLLTTAAFVASGAAAVKVAEMAGRMMRQTARGAADAGRGRQDGPGGVEISWSYVEIRWPI
jgi:hypothetical protein